MVDVVACDSTDTSSVVVAAHSLGAEVRVASSPDAWFDQVTRLAGDDSLFPADLVAIVGSAERIASQRLVAKACAAASETPVLAALVDASLDRVASVVNQGARGLLLLPSSNEAVTVRLREVLEPATSRQVLRRDIVRHRRALGTLTPAEVDVLDGMLAGMPNKQIAHRLSIGLRTVELRRSKIMRKMKAKSIAQLISYVCMGRRLGG